MHKIKVCYIISTLQNCGPVNILYGILSNMDYDRFDVSIITFNPEKTDSRIDDFRDLPINIVNLTKEEHINNFKIYIGLKREVDTIKPDILHGHCPGSLMMIPLMGNRYKKVYTPHNFPGKYIRLIYGNKKGVVVQAIHNLMIGRYDKVICCSESVLEAYHRPLDSRYIAIPNGTTMPVWNRNLREKEALRKEFGFEDGVKYFIYLGRFASGKNIPVIADAFHNIGKDDIKIVMVGTGPLFDDVKKLNSPNILLPGYTTRVSDYLKAADYYISASDSEGMPNTLLENLSVGNPMLLSGIPAHNEFLRNFNENEVALLINQHEVNDIHAKIIQILKFDSESVAQKVQQVFINKYTAEVMSKKYQDEYISLSQQA